MDRRVFAGLKSPESPLEMSKALHRAASLQTAAREIMEELGRPTFEILQAAEDNPTVLAAAERESFGISVATQRGWKDDGSALRAWRTAVERRGVFVLQMDMPEAEYLDLQVPADISDCAYHMPWGPGIYAQGPSHQWHLWILDVDGVRVIVQTYTFPGTSPEDRAELEAIVGSLQVSEPSSPVPSPTLAATGIPS